MAGTWAWSSSNHTKNATKLRSELAVFVDHGNRVTARGRRTNAGAVDPGQNRAIREWADSKGYEVAERGRINQEIVDSFHQTARR